MVASTIVDTRQYLSFELDHEIFALDISKVREVLDYTAVTKIPQMPDFMRGVINLRGHVVPVIDLKLKCGMSMTEEAINTCIIILDVSVDGEETVIGALADSVQEVFDLSPENIEPPPRIGTKLNTEFIKGMGKHGEAFLMILDVNKVFSHEDITGIMGATEDAGPEEMEEEEG